MKNKRSSGSFQKQLRYINVQSGCRTHGLGSCVTPLSPALVDGIETANDNAWQEGGLQLFPPLFVTLILTIFHLVRRHHSTISLCTGTFSGLIP